MHFVKFHPEVASSLLSRSKRNYAPLGMRLFMKIHKKIFFGIPINSHFLSYLQNYKEFEAEILDLLLENMGFHLILKNVLFLVEPWG